MENTNQSYNDKSVSSVELTKNTKGYSWSIKVYDNDLDMAKVRIESLDQYFRIKFGEDQRRKEIKEHHEEEFSAGVL